jgi:hypothetical protein
MGLSSATVFFHHSSQAQQTSTATRKIYEHMDNIVCDVAGGVD